MYSDAEIEAGFQAAQYLHRLQRMRETVEDLDYWRRLNPELTISDQPFAARRPPYSVSPDEVKAYLRQLREEGYFHAAPLIPSDALSRLREGIARVARAGFPSVFAGVYDEFYQTFDGITALLTPVLGEDYLMVPEGFGAWHIAADSVHGNWPGPAWPHRDSLGPDRHDLASQLPTLVNVWIPLTDATPLNSCIYLVPANLDPDYYSQDRGFHPDRIPWQHIRGVPAAAGSILCWTTHLLHWGSHGSSHATTPRISVAIYFQSRHVPLYHESAFEIPSAVPFHDRLRWIALTLRNPSVFDFPRTSRAEGSRPSP